MPPFIKINDAGYIELVLSKLTPATLPLWGTMKPQQMIEHLIETIGYTNGKRIAELETSPEEVLKEKLAKVTADFEIPKNVKGPIQDNAGIMFKDLSTAINELKKEIERFEQFFKIEGQTSIHASFGPLNYNEWILWHGKHFAHHFKQFGLLDD